MKVVTELKANRTYAGPGVYAFDAEAVVLDTETDQTVYVHVNLYDGFENYTVSESSLWDDVDDDDETGDVVELFDPNTTFTVDPEIAERINAMTPEQLAEVERTGRFPWDDEDSRYIEEYDKLSKTKQSAYSKVFAELSKMIKLIGEDIG